MSLTPSDVLNTARVELHTLFYGNVNARAGCVFSIDVCESVDLPCGWLASIQVNERTGTRPVTFFLSLEHPRSPPGSPRGESPIVFEMRVLFIHKSKHYCYWSGHWYENGQAMPAELVERFHPLAHVSAATVDATVWSVHS